MSEMKLPAKYSERAARDLLKAVGWYEEKRRGLGFEFLNCVEHSVTMICGEPLLFCEVKAPIRRCLVRRFPFSIYYSVEMERIVIHSIFDNRMDPAKLPRPLRP